MRQHPANGGRVLQGSATAFNGVPAEYQNCHQQKGDHRQVQVGIRTELYKCSEARDKNTLEKGSFT